MRSLWFSFVAILFCIAARSAAWAQVVPPPLGLVAQLGCGSRVGEIPHTPLIEAPDGMLYGATQAGGELCGGTIFRFDPAAKKIKPLVQLDIVNLGDRIFALTLASDGNFYGVTCGSQKQGIFQYKPGDSAINYVWSGGGDSGCFTGLIEGSDGNLYGTTYYGGKYGWGIVFSHSKTLPAPGQPQTPLTILANFGDTADNGQPGQTLFAGVVEASDGNFYGETYSGGKYSVGTIYKVAPNTSSDTANKVWDFLPATGDYGAALLMEGPNTTLYATAQGGGCQKVSGVGTGPCPTWTPGVIWSLNYAQANSYVDQYEFGSSVSPDASIPGNGAFEFGPNGSLYNTTQYGGSNNTGAAYQYTLCATPGGCPYQFAGSFLPLQAGLTGDRMGTPVRRGPAVSGTGDYPVTGFTLASDGDLYGVTVGSASTVGDGSIVRLQFVTSPSPAQQPQPPSAINTGTGSIDGNALTLNWTLNNAYSNTDRLCFVSKVNGDGAWTAVGKISAGAPGVQQTSTLTSTLGAGNYAITCGGRHSNHITVEKVKPGRPQRQQR